MWDSESLQKQLGFKIPVAIIHCKNSWTIVSIFSHGLMDELMLPYIKQCGDCSTTLNVIDFEKWVQNVTHSNYTFLHVLGLMLFGLPLPRGGFFCTVSSAGGALPRMAAASHQYLVTLISAKSLF